MEKVVTNHEMKNNPKIGVFVPSGVANLWSRKILYTDKGNPSSPRDRV